MTNLQHANVRNSLIAYKPIAEIHHGLCRGADHDFHNMCNAMRLPKAVIHPPKNTGSTFANIGAVYWWCSDLVYEKSLEYLERNEAIVDACTVLFAAPDSMTEQLRSGTWATLRYNWKADRKPFLIFYPDGRVLNWEGVPF